MDTRVNAFITDGGAPLAGYDTAHGRRFPSRRATSPSGWKSLYDVDNQQHTEEHWGEIGLDRASSRAVFSGVSGCGSPDSLRILPLISSAGAAIHPVRAIPGIRRQQNLSAVRRVSGCASNASPHLHWRQPNSGIL